ncbi:MAG TPA: LptF/LptG family permease [Tepidisphaeraceae bacterium]|nr:LptF/LptG family permease [Tepidisphaeraceae bacterium]
MSKQRQFIFAQMSASSGRKRRTPAERPPPRPHIKLPPANRRTFLGQPVMGIIDRYVLYSFLKNWILSFVVLMGLYIVLDMVMNFDEFVKPQSGDEVISSPSVSRVIWGVVSYYFFQSFRVFSYLSGLITVVAASFTLMRMSRFNELVTMMASGVPLLRIGAPIFYAGFALTFLLIINQELIVPKILPELTRDRGDEMAKGTGRPIQAMPDGIGGLVFVGAYTPPTRATVAKMDVLDVVIRNGSDISILTAEKAQWDPDIHKWQLTNGKLSPMTGNNSVTDQPRPVVVYDAEGCTPESIALFVSRGDFVDLLSTKRINELLSMKNAVGQIDLLRVRDSRVSTYFINIILIGLAIPCVLTREPRLLRTSAMWIFGSVGACMSVVFITQNMAGLPAPSPALALKWPAIMCWLPVFVFGGIAVAMLDRIRT